MVNICFKIWQPRLNDYRASLSRKQLNSEPWLSCLLNGTTFLSTVAKFLEIIVLSSIHHLNFSEIYHRILLLSTPDCQPFVRLDVAISFPKLLTFLFKTTLQLRIMIKWIHYHLICLLWCLCQQLLLADVEKWLFTGSKIGVKKTSKMWTRLISSCTFQFSKTWGIFLPDAIR